MKKAFVFIAILALLVQPSFNFSPSAIAQEPGPFRIYLPILLAGSSTEPPPSNVWTPQQKTEIAGIVNTAGNVKPIAPDTNTVESVIERDQDYEYYIDKHHVVDNRQSVYYLGLNDDLIWPGNLIRGDTAHDFLYTPILTPRAPVVISVNLETVSCAGDLARQVNDPNLHNMRNGIRELLQIARKDCTTIPAQVNFDYESVYNESHLNLFVGANVKYGAGNLSTKFNWNDTTKKSRVIAKYEQVFYSVDITTPSSPAEIFDPTRVTVSDIRASLPAGSKPIYVAGIKYGMMALMFLESSYSEKTMEFALQAAYDDKLTSVDGETQLNAKTIMENSSIKIVVYGGSTAGLGELETGLPGFLKVIHASMNAGPDSPGVPLVYKFRHLSDNTLAQITMTSDYATKTRIPLRPKIRVSLIKFKATMVDDEGWGNNEVEMDRFQLNTWAFNKRTLSGPSIAAQSPNPRFVVNWATPGEYPMKVGDEWPALNLQGSYYIDIEFNNEYPYNPDAPGDWDWAQLGFVASARDYDTTSPNDWGSGEKVLTTGKDILAVGTGDKPLFEIISDDFRMDVYIKIELLNP